MDGLYSIPWLLVGYVVPFIVVLSLLVFVHEMGHYLAGRWSGIRILAFSVGFGPEIAGFTDRHGTRWKISAIPLGGYVRFFGDEDAASRPDFDGIAELTPAERETTMAGAKLWKRAVTVAAGPIANFILAIAIFAVVFAINGKPVVDPVVAETRPGSAAAEAGVLPGDVLLALDGQKVATFDDVRRYVSMRPDIEILVTVKRGEETLDLPMIPKKSEITDQFGNKMEVGLIGIVTSQERGNFRVQELSPLEAGRRQSSNLAYRHRHLRLSEQSCDGPDELGTAGWTGPNRQDVRGSGHFGHHRLSDMGGHAVGVDRFA